MSFNMLLQRKKLSPYNTKIYKSLGSLIKEYREWRHISQEAFSESIKISVRELQNWEANRRRARIENLHDIAELTRIPMQVLVTLNADQPIWYSLRKRFFSYSFIENALFYSNELFMPGLKSEYAIKATPITTEKHMDIILSCHQDLYGTKSPLQKDVIKAANAILPDLNIIIFDYWGYYIAHRIYLPIKLNVYEALIKQKSLENYLTSQMISDIIALKEGVFFLYSTYATNISAEHRLISGDIRVFSKIKPKERYLFVSHTTTEESAIIQNNLNMSFVKNYYDMYGEVCSIICETNLDFQMRPNGPFRHMIESLDENLLIKNLISETQQKSLLSNHRTKPRDPVSPLKIYSQGEMAQSDVLTVDKNAVLTVDTLSSNSEKQNYQKRLKSQIPSELKITIEVCPNIKCALYAKSDKANIISNGTFRLKDGTTLRRYICKECGKSFCSRTSSIFYGIRSQDEKVMEALKLLVKGMSLRGVAKIIGVEFRTVRSWLKVAAEQNEKINEMFIKKLKVTQIELDALWAFVKSNSLRQRSFLCRTKNKSHITD